MIDRYSSPEMKEIWSDRSRFKAWLRVEIAVLEDHAASGILSSKEWKALGSKLRSLLASGGVDPARVATLERATKHDVLAFTQAVSERIGPRQNRFFHFGLTSSDVVDTALMLLLQEAGSAILKQGNVLLDSLKERALRHKDLPTIGRTHGMFAEPSSFGLKFLGWHSEWVRSLERLRVALEDNRYGKLSGAVGVNAILSPLQEERILRRLGLKREPVSTQVLPRDRIAAWMGAVAVAGGALERMALELRHLQRSEVGELREEFSKEQKGSSAMPHKRNPISSENITGCARLLRSYCGAAYEDIALWHERDISHSSVERVILPDATILFEYAIGRMDRLIRGLVVDEGRIAANLARAGVQVYSGRVLLEVLRRSSYSREQAYRWIQAAALDAADSGGDFAVTLFHRPEIRKILTLGEIQALCSPKEHLRNVSEIYRRSGVRGRAPRRKSRRT